MSAYPLTLSNLIILSHVFSSKLLTAAESENLEIAGIWAFEDPLLDYICTDRGMFQFSREALATVYQSSTTFS